MNDKRRQKKHNNPNSRKYSKAQFKKVASRVEKDLNNFLDNNPTMKKKIMDSLFKGKEK